MKEIKVEWCENFIKALFEKHFPEAEMIYDGLFWDLAEKSGLWERGTYGSPMSKALEKLTEVKTVTGADGKFAYNAFHLKK